MCSHHPPARSTASSATCSNRRTAAATCPTQTKKPSTNTCTYQHCSAGACPRCSMTWRRTKTAHCSPIAHRIWQLLLPRPRQIPPQCRLSAGMASQLRRVWRQLSKPSLSQFLQIADKGRELRCWVIGLVFGSLPVSSVSISQRNLQFFQSTPKKSLLSLAVSNVFGNLLQLTLHIGEKSHWCGGVLVVQKKPVLKAGNRGNRFQTRLSQLLLTVASKQGPGGIQLTQSPVEGLVIIPVE